MKKQLAVLAATAVLGVTTAFAANPFADVTPQDWAYQAVAQLASQGIVNGYPDGTFQGQNNITRFEMAQMVAKAMARQDRVDAEQNAIINRLANEFAAELNNLGVRVATLEDKVGNFKFSGDVRLRYVGKNDGRNSSFDYRGRVKFEGTVNDNTKAVVRLTTAARKFGNGVNTVSDGVTNNDGQIDRIYVQHNFGKYATAEVGRHNLTIGSGFLYDNTFDGATLTFGKDALNASVSHGYITDGSLYKNTKAQNSEVTSYTLRAKLGNHVSATGFYTNVHNKRIMPQDGTSVTLGNSFGGSLNATFDKLSFDGDFTKAETVADSQAWQASVAYGNFSFKKPGSWSVRAQYANLDKNAQIIDSTYLFPYTSDFKGWVASAKYAPAKNIGLAAYASIDSKRSSTDKERPEWYRGEINYKF